NALRTLYTNSRGVPKSKLFFTSQCLPGRPICNPLCFFHPICRSESTPRKLFQLDSAHVPSLPSPRRASPHHQTRRSSCPRRARLDEHVHRGHHDGRPPSQQRRRHRSRRRCLQAMNMVRPVAFALVSANIINAVGNYVLIYGKWGFPNMGTVGSGWSTAAARAYMALVLVVYLLWYDRKHRTELLKTPIDID